LPIFVLVFVNENHTGSHPKKVSRGSFKLLR